MLFCVAPLQHIYFCLFVELDVESREENYTVLHFLALQKTAGENKELRLLLENLLSHQELVKIFPPIPRYIQYIHTLIEISICSL